MNKGMKKRWISLYVENQVGVLSKISGLFSAKSYNLDSLTVGTTEDPTVSRMTIATVSDDETFEQIKKQLNRMVEVIKVIDFTDVFVRMKEILYIKVFNCSAADKVELFQIAETFKAKVIDYGKDSLLLEFVQTATKNDAVVELMKEEFGKIEVVRGGSVGIESINVMEREKRGRFCVNEKSITTITLKKINKKSVYQYIYEHRQTAKQQIVQDLTMGLSMHSGTLEHICIDPEGPECYCASFY